MNLERIVAVTKLAEDEAVLQLALETGASTRTIARWLHGRRVGIIVAYALSAAADKLNLDLSEFHGGNGTCHHGSKSR